MVTGKSDRYWTAGFFDEDSSSKEPRLLPEEDSMPFMDVEVDPIILKADTKGSGTTASPRAYALAALAVSLGRVIEHHKNIQGWFKASLSLHVSFRSTGERKGSVIVITVWLRDA